MKSKFRTDYILEIIFTILGVIAIVVLFSYFLLDSPNKEVVSDSQWLLIGILLLFAGFQIFMTLARIFTLEVTKDQIIHRTPLLSKRRYFRIKDITDIHKTYGHAVRRQTQAVYSKWVKYAISIHDGEATIYVSAKAFSNAEELIKSIQEKRK